MSKEIRIIPIEGLGDIAPGDDLAAIISQALKMQNLALLRGDIVVVTQKIVSKAEGRVVDLEQIEPSAFAQSIAQQYNKDAQHIEVVLRESKRIVRMDHGVLISETSHGFICANAGVDESNVNGKRQLTLLPVDSDASAQQLRSRLLQVTEVDNDIAVIISDTWGRPWRNGQINMAIGVAGMESLIDYRGQNDPYGYELHASVIAVADELASAAELVMGKIESIPVAIIRGYTYIPARGDASTLVRDPATDMFR